MVRPRTRRGGWLGAIGALTLCACVEVPVLEGASPQEALDVQQRLAAAGLSAEVSADMQGYSVTLPRDHVAEAIAALARPPGRKTCPANPSSGALLPSPQQEARAASDLRECTLASDLELLPHVVEARVRLVLEVADLEAPSAPRASVLLLTDGPVHAPDVVQHLSQAVPGLSSGSIAVTVRQRAVTARPQTQRSADLERLGPLTLTRASRPLAETLFAALLLSNLVTASLLLLVWHRARRR